MTVLVLYIGGIVVGLFGIDARAPVRVGLALLWPLGPAAFLLTVAFLLVVAAIAFPLFGLVLAGVAAVGWWAT